MHPQEMPRHRLKMLAAVTGMGAMAVLGGVAVIDAATPGPTESLATKFSSTTTVKPPPTVPEISFAAPTVKAPHK
ncbi:hypothetical protein [Mycobacterium sp. DL440]|uniref:hypothetical protein n=1 Tax=Mycobacterium sp. DL440 TaxID=2675523 RepID=UPI001FBA1174|nr:hypothetical protein [Mycobacterium sp. DL440]